MTAMRRRESELPKLPPERRNLIRLPPALLKRIKRVALRARVTYGEAIEHMIRGEEGRMDPYTALVELRQYLDSYGDALADVIAEESGKVRARVVARAVAVLDELEEEWPAALEDDEDDEDDEEEQEEQEDEDQQ